MLFIKLYRHNSFRLCCSIGNMSHIVPHLVCLMVVTLFKDQQNMLIQELLITQLLYGIR